MVTVRCIPFMITTLWHPVQKKCEMQDKKSNQSLQCTSSSCVTFKIYTVQCPTQKIRKTQAKKSNHSIQKMISSYLPFKIATAWQSIYQRFKLQAETLISPSSTQAPPIFISRLLPCSVLLRNDVKRKPKTPIRLSRTHTPPIFLSLLLICNALLGKGKNESIVLQFLYLVQKSLPSSFQDHYYAVPCSLKT